MAGFVHDCTVHDTHRMLIGRGPVQSPEHKRPRVVDAVAYEHEITEWKDVGRCQSDAEWGMKDDQTWPKVSDANLPKVD